MSRWEKQGKRIYLHVGHRLARNDSTSKHLDQILDTRSVSDRTVQLKKNQLHCNSWDISKTYRSDDRDEDCAEDECDEEAPPRKTTLGSVCRRKGHGHRGNKDTDVPVPLKYTVGM